MSFTKVYKETRCIYVHLCCVLTPASRQVPTVPFVPPYPTFLRQQWTGQEWQKGENLWVEIKTFKQVKKKGEKPQAMQGQPLTTSHKWSNALPVSEECPTWKDSSFLPPPKFLLLCMMFSGTQYPFGQIRCAVQAVSPSNFLPISALLAYENFHTCKSDTLELLLYLFFSLS